MKTIEDVINGLKCCLNDDKCGDCPYVGLGADCVDYLYLDALRLMKERAELYPVKVVIYGDREWYECGKCRMEIVSGSNYCSYCGTKVKWVELER